MDNTKRSYKIRKKNIESTHRITGFVCLISSAMCAMLHIACFYCLRELMTKAQAIDNTINYANMPREIMLIGVIGYIMAGAAIILFTVGIIYYVRARRCSKPRQEGGCYEE